MEYIILLAIILLIAVVMGVYYNLKKLIQGLFVKEYNQKKQMQELRRFIASEHKLTRKETQELKTRATQDRKDLNSIQKSLKNAETHLSIKGKTASRELAKLLKKSK